MGFDRNPFWYPKELELKMSCSYGPGRYDLNYEEKGIDYPVAYVRWTEKRNMQAFQELLFKKRIDIGYLTTHEFNFMDAPKAFDLIINKTEPYVGIALKYDIGKDINKDKIVVNPESKRGGDKRIIYWSRKLCSRKFTALYKIVRKSAKDRSPDQYRNNFKTA